MALNKADLQEIGNLITDGINNIVSAMQPAQQAVPNPPQPSVQVPYGHAMQETVYASPQIEQLNAAREELLKKFVSEPMLTVVGRRSSEHFFPAEQKINAINQWINDRERFKSGVRVTR